MFLPDFKDLLSALSDQNADYLIVGAYAVAVHAEPRATGDMDVWIRRDPETAGRVWRALASFGASLHDVTENDLQTPGLILQLGVPPVRIDILTSIEGVDFAEAWRERVVVEVDDLEVSVIGRDHLLMNKRAAGRPKDLIDVRLLEQADG